jgi:hypothetical protein
MSIIVKGSFTVLALMGIINLWIAVAVGDMGLSLTVILNAMRLTRVKACCLRGAAEMEQHLLPGFRYDKKTVRSMICS